MKARKRRRPRRAEVEAEAAPPGRFERFRRGIGALSRGEVSLVLAGVNLMLLNFIMVQHATLAFRRPEVAVVVFSLAYFSGVSLGYLVSDRLSATTVRRLLPVFLLVQLGLLVGVQPLHYQLSRSVGQWAEGHQWSSSIGEWSAAAALFLIVTGFVTSPYAIFLPRVIEDEGKELRRCYSLEIGGSILGLALVPVLASISHEALLGGYLVTFVALARAVGTGTLVVSGMAGAAVFFLMAFAGWDHAGASWVYSQIYGWTVDAVELTAYTPYHKIEVLRSGEDYRLLLNGKRQFASDPRLTYAYFVAEYPARLLGAPSVCLLGCGSMATVGRIGSFVPSVTIVDLDAEVFAASRRYFRRQNHLDTLHNWSFVADDAKHWLGTSSETFDLILHDIPPAHSRQVALTYTDEFFRLVKARLRPGGIFSISSLTPFSKESHYGKRMMRTLARVFERYVVLIERGSVYFYGGGPGLVLPDRGKLIDAVEPNRRAGVKLLEKDELDELVAGEDVITISNVGDLIYD